MEVKGFEERDVAFDIPNKAAECLDMYPVAVDGDRNKIKWVISDAATKYEVGDFDGKSWKGDSPLDSKAFQLNTVLITGIVTTLHKLLVRRPMVELFILVG